MTKNNNKGSAKKKLLPAAAMLTTSAVMLSTATYAWFTMNKEVEVTGLQMSATTSDALEISLGARGETVGSTTINHAESSNKTHQPSDKDVSWTNKEVIGSYYKEVGKLKPASSADAITLYNAGDVSNGGRYATNFTALTDANKATLNLQETYNSTGTISTLEDGAETYSGSYIDIPVWLRTSKTKPSTDDDDMADLYCAIKISRRTSAAEGVTATEELYKAVRVAFLPAKGADGSSLTDPTTSEAGTVYGVSDTTYDQKKVVKAAGVRSDTTLALPSPGVTTTVATGDTYLTTKMAATIPYGTADSYGRQQFIVRVWLEGEDVNCWDLTSNQDWNIDFAFSLSAFDNTNKPTFATSTT